MYELMFSQQSNENTKTQYYDETNIVSFILSIFRYNQLLTRLSRIIPANLFLYRLSIISITKPFILCILNVYRVLHMNRVQCMQITSFKQPQILFRHTFFMLISRKHSIMYIKFLSPLLNCAVIKQVQRHQTE